MERKGRKFAAKEGALAVAASSNTSCLSMTFHDEASTPERELPKPDVEPSTPKKTDPSTPKKARKDNDSETYHGYVLKLSKVMLSPRKTKYFRAVLHNGTEEMSVLSYNPQLYDTMAKAKNVEKPVELSHYSEKVDEFNNQPLLMLASRSSIQYSNQDLPFEKVQSYIEKHNSFTKLNEINSLSVEEMVNLLAYVDVSDDNPACEINTRFGLRKKRDVFLYDESQQIPIKLTLWNQFIDMVQVSGSFKFQESFKFASEI